MALLLGGQEAGPAALGPPGGREDPGPAALDVLDYRLHPELELRGAGTAPRELAITQIVLHWTGGEPRDVHAFREVLRRRRVGAHFFVDRQGTIWQLADPLELVTFHAGGLVNRRSIGIEVACYGFRWPARTRWSLLEVPARARDRDIYRTRIARAGYFLADFYPVQTQAVALLVDALLEELPDVARTVPLEADGSLRTRRFTRREARSYSGILGHLHVPGSTKLDPGTRPLEVLRLRYHEGG